ncbi:hypothetical protein B0H17DRAFT_1045250 [Mycena rosella]|uniref:Secreted protein n=1 Tax=Mycena rosella TaxID=1033263 RepID=A0AAD7GQH1_MYCRO|nr:hypothetical protein B0H17DRAFT_1045250 [Mycena rosella]
MWSMISPALGGIMIHSTVLLNTAHSASTPACTERRRNLLPTSSGPTDIPHRKTSCRPWRPAS